MCIHICDSSNAGQLVYGKSTSQNTDVTETFYICHTYMTQLTLKPKVSEKSHYIDYEFRVSGKLEYAFISVVAVMLSYWHGKSVSQSTDMTETFYIQRQMYMTPLTLKLKKSHIRL